MNPPPTRSSAARIMTLLAWLMTLVMLAWGFNRLLEQQRNPNGAVNGSREGGVAQVELQRNRAGHYVVNGEINSQRVEFLLDTGATQVAVPESLARHMNLPRLAPIALQTANGVTHGWATRLDEVRLGPIVARDVAGTIAPGLDENGVLLGMSFLKRLELIQRGETLLLRQYN